MINKYIKIINNQKGMALITAFMFGLISIGLVGAIYFAMQNATRTTGVEAKYTAQLEISRGISEFVRAAIREDVVNRPHGLQCCASQACTSHVPCDDGTFIDLSGFITEINNADTNNLQTNYTNSDISAQFIFFVASKKTAPTYVFALRTRNPDTNTIEATIDRGYSIVNPSKI
jgi:hypothetical protein